MQERQHLKKLEKVKVKINFYALIIFLVFFIANFCEASITTTKRLYCQSAKSTGICLEDSTYIKCVAVDLINIEVLYTDFKDSISLRINILNTSDPSILIGVASLNTSVSNINDVEQSILPDINLNENIVLTSLERGYSISIIQGTFHKFNTYRLVFYVVNDWNKFIKCVHDKTKIRTYQDSLGQTLIQLSHDEMPEEGISIITVSNISSLNKLSEMSCEIHRY